MDDIIIKRVERKSEDFAILARGIYKNTQFYIGVINSVDAEFGEDGIEIVSKAYPVGYVELTAEAVRNEVISQEVTYVGLSHIDKDTVVFGWDYAHLHNKRYANAIEVNNDLNEFIADAKSAIDSFAL